MSSTFERDKITGRPAGEVRQALGAAAKSFWESGEAPTLVDLAMRAQVGAEAAMHTVKNMTRAGDLVIVGEREVGYRNRPVAEYAPAVRGQVLDTPVHDAPIVVLGDALSRGWR